MPRTVAVLVGMLGLIFAAGAESGGDDGLKRSIQNRFLAPCCWRESVAVHDSPVAIQMRSEIDRQIADGKTEQEIVEVFVARYGERILREPRGVRFVILTALPWTTAGAGAVGLVLYLRRVAQRRAATLPIATPPGGIEDIDSDWP